MAPSKGVLLCRFCVAARSQETHTKHITDFSNLALAEDQWLFLECYDMHDAAEGGHLEVLKWLKENGCRGTQPRAMKLQAQSARDHQVGKGNGCPWSEKASSDAAEYGEVESSSGFRRTNAPVSESVMTLAGQEVKSRSASGEPTTAVRGILPPGSKLHGKGPTSTTLAAAEGVRGPVRSSSGSAPPPERTLEYRGNPRN